MQKYPDLQSICPVQYFKWFRYNINIVNRTSVGARVGRLMSRNMNKILVCRLYPYGALKHLLRWRVYQESESLIKAMMALFAEAYMRH